MKNKPVTHIVGWGGGWYTLLCGRARMTNTDIEFTDNVLKPYNKDVKWCKTCKMLYNANYSKQGKVLK